VVRRHELTDEQWQTIEALLPPSGANGRPVRPAVGHPPSPPASTGGATWSNVASPTSSNTAPSPRVMTRRPVSPGHDRPGHPAHLAL